MSEIPDDVMNAARAVAIAILAERERCAKIAEDMDGENTSTFTAVRLAKPYEPKPYIGTKPLGVSIAEAIRGVGTMTKAVKP